MSLILLRHDDLLGWLLRRPEGSGLRGLNCIFVFYSSLSQFTIVILIFVSLQLTMSGQWGEDIGILMAFFVVCDIVISDKVLNCEWCVLVVVL